jgi:hypothetical protein
MCSRNAFSQHDDLAYLRPPLNHAASALKLDHGPERADPPHAAILHVTEAGKEFARAVILTTAKNKDQRVAVCELREAVMTDESLIAGGGKVLPSPLRLA